MDAVPVCIVGRDGLTQFGKAHHGRILIVAVQNGVGGLAADILGSGIVGKALTEIDGVGVARELRHHLEDRDREIPECFVHGLNVKA